MKALFIVERNLYYKFYGPVISELLSKGIQVHLLHLSASHLLQRSNNKAFYYPFLSQVPSFHNGTPIVASYRSDDELHAYIKQHDIHNIFSLQSRGSYHADFTGVRWHTLQHGIDTLVENGFDSDHLYVYTQSWIKESRLLVPAYTEVHDVGLYHLGPIASRQEILAKYGLPDNRKFLFFAPLPFDGGSEYFFLGNNRFDRWCINRNLIKKEKSLLRELSQTLHANGWDIILKSRFKRFLDQDYLGFGHVLYDETFFPSTVNELISISESVVCNLMPSALCTEALKLKKPYYVLHHPEHDKKLIPYMDQEIPKLFNPGLEKDFLSSNDLSWALKMVQSQLPPQPHQRYISQYLTPASGEDLSVFTAYLK